MQHHTVPLFLLIILWILFNALRLPLDRLHELIHLPYLLV